MRYIIILLLLVSCTTSTGVIPYGPDTYTITTNTGSGDAEAKRVTLNKALNYCQAQEKFLLPIIVNSSTRSVIATGHIDSLYELTFRCIEKSEYEQLEIKKESNN